LATCAVPARSANPGPQGRTAHEEAVPQAPRHTQVVHHLSASQPDPAPAPAAAPAAAVLAHGMREDHSPANRKAAKVIVLDGRPVALAN